MLPRRPWVLEVGQRLVLFEYGRTGGDVGHLLPELLRQWLHGRRVGTLLPDADGDRLVGVGTGREVRVTEAGDLGHLGAPEGPPPARDLLHLPGRRLPPNDADVHGVLLRCGPRWRVPASPHHRPQAPTPQEAAG